MNEKYGKGTVELKLEDSYFNMKQQIEPHMNLIENVLTVYEKLDIRAPDTSYPGRYRRRTAFL